MTDTAPTDRDSDPTSDTDSDGDDDRESRRDAGGLALTGADLAASYPERRYHDQVAAEFTLPAQPAQHVPAEEVLPPQIASRLGFDPYSHQAEALDALAAGENVSVATSTSSGKTLIFALHVARRFLDDPETRALVVYPTKALSRDQEGELNDLFGELGLDVAVGVYDGDTPSGEKARIREAANVVITNVVGLNQYLEGHHRWAAFHANCDLVVVDEAHSWTGLSGMHVAWILRRLRRVVEWYGGDPQYVLTSATIGNPGEHAVALTGEPATVVDEDGSPSGTRHLVFWDPPTRDDGHLGADRADRADRTDQGAAGQDPFDGEASPFASKRPASVEAPEVWAHLCASGVQSLLFCDSRKLTELSVDRGKEFLRDPSLPYANDGSAGSAGSATRTSLASYNAGHGKKARRGTEYQLREGVLDGVASTSALEVGINVGGVDGTVLLGYPGSRQSFWQRIGRSGRGTRDALSVVVPRHATLDQYVLEHPDYLLESEHERAVVDLSNNPVYLQHVACAAQELPLTRDDAALLGGDDFAGGDDPAGGAERLERAVEYGRRTGDLEGSLDGGVTYAHRDRPQDAVELYAAGGNAVEVRLAGDGSIDHESIGEARAARDYHVGATVLYRGDQYEVVDRRTDGPRPYVELERVDVDYFTQSQGQVRIYDTQVEESRDIAGFRLNWGYGTVAVHHATYLTREIGSGEVLERGLDTGSDPVTMRTQLCWVEVPGEVERAVRNRHSDYYNNECQDLPPRLHGYLGGIHAVEHAMIAVAPLELTVDDADLGGLATNRLPGTPDASGWFVYDGVEGGVGFARSIYDEFEAVARRAHDLIADCGCGRDEGCPACTMDHRCGNDNKPLYSPAATDVLAATLGDLTVDDLADHLPDTDGVEPLDDQRPPAQIS